MTKISFDAMYTQDMDEKLNSSDIIKNIKYYLSLIKHIAQENDLLGAEPQYWRVQLIRKHEYEFVEIMDKSIFMIGKLIQRNKIKHIPDYKFSNVSYGGVSTWIIADDRINLGLDISKDYSKTFEELYPEYDPKIQQVSKKIMKFMDQHNDPCYDENNYDYDEE